MADTGNLRGLDPYRWGTIFAVLSLDLAAQHVSAMGLQLPAGDSFRQGLRNIILEFRKRQAQSPGTKLQFAESVFDWTRSEYDASFSLHLHDWGQNVFQYNDGAGASVFLWNNIVRHGGLDGSRDADVTPPNFVRMLRKQLAARIVPNVARTPATAWDRELYVRQSYDELMNPSEFIKSTISYYNFVSAWNETVRNSESPVELQSTYVWAQGVAERLRMPVSRVGKPGDWPDLPKPWKGKQDQT